MENEITKIVEDSWQKKRLSLMEEIDRAARAVENILTLENYHREGHKVETVGQSLGEFGSHALDPNALATLLSQGDEKRRMSAERLERIQKIYRKLDQIRQGYRQTPPQGKIVSIEEETQKILRRSEEHLNSMARLFGLIRMAHMEVKAKYHTEEHDAYFSRFNWRQMDDTEVSLCPPFIVWGETQKTSESFYSKFLALLSEGVPLKILFFFSELSKRASAEGRLIPLHGSVNLELLPLTFRKIYLLQTASVNSNLKEQLAKGLSVPRPGVFFILKKDETLLSRSEEALASRAFPYIAYNPEASTDFVSCLDLSANPDVHRLWPKTALNYLTGEGKAETLERDFTYADFASREKGLKDQFTPLPSNISEEKAVVLSEYLTRTPAERTGKVPFIYAVDEKKHLIQLVPSPSIIAQTADRMHLWQSLREVAGIDNPHLRALEHKLKTQLTEDKEKTVNQLKAEMEARLKAGEKQAVYEAMKNLAVRLMGLEGAKIDIKSFVSHALSAKVPTMARSQASGLKEAAAEVQKKPSGDQVWIESKLCTTCDECITINKKIFGYNKDKKAVVLDPKGGPFRDIVKAAEKCSAKIIHPGRPLDPKEKDLDKWVKRAEKFQ
ncbi:MAG: hypothetical protein A3B79_01395 [Deltaproteobacteria bacterium RIFCSPHIGHO2_02_FULL_50_15]|nr:MAG: hypothetical protein A3B79_01395 [Deltaproteobacteria bacterium RIFCSPHIGHO2_02_FULL_50_15]